MNQKIILGILTGLLFIPALSFASDGNTNAQKLTLMEQTIITPLREHMQELKNSLKNNGRIPSNVAARISNIKEKVELIKKENDGDNGNNGTATPQEYSLALSTSTVSTSVEVQGSNDTTGIFMISFDVSAASDDVYIKNFVGNNASGTSRGIAYAFEGQEGVSQSISSLTSSADIVNENVFLIREGETERFTLVIASSFDISGQRRVILKEINYTNFPDGITNVKALIPTPESVFRTQYLNVVGSSVSDPDDTGTDSSTSTPHVDSYLEILLSSQNPATSYIIVDAEDKTSDQLLLSMQIEPEGESISLDQIVVRIDSPNGVLANVIDEAHLTFGGVEYSPESIGSLAAGQSEIINSSAAWYLYDISASSPLAEDQKYTINISVDLKEQEGNYQNGQVISAKVDTDERVYWKAQGENALNAPHEFPGSAIGNEHILISESITLDNDSVVTRTENQGEQDTVGIFTIEFDVTAFAGDFYIDDTATEGADNTTAGVSYSIGGSSGTYITSGTLSSTADDDSGAFLIRDGETETFILTATLEPNTTGQYRVTLTEINFSQVPDGTTNTAVLIPTPASDFRTSYININN